MNRLNLVSPFELLTGQLVAKSPESNIFEIRSLHGLVPQGLLLKAVLIKLDPEISESMGRIVRIGNDLRTTDPLLLIIEDYLNFVIRSLLPVFGTGSPICSANLIRVRKDLINLTKRVLGVVPSGMS